MKIAKLVLTGVMLVIGVVGAAAGLFENPENLPLIGPVLGDHSQLMTFLLGFLITFTALEMAVVNLETNGAVAKTLKNTEEIAEVLQKQSPFVLESEDVIYNYASKEVAKARRLVRAVTFREVHRQDEPDYWAALVTRMQVKNDSIEYRHIYGYLDAENVRLAESYHRAYFKAQGLERYWKPKFLHTSSGVDMLIVDNTCVIMSLPVLASDDSLRRAVVLPAISGFVDDVAMWFENYLEDRAETAISG